ncbi:hypothetical protein EMCRGX_G009214 [Ephydatia muelleri]
MSSNREYLATIVSYVCLLKFTSKLLGVAQSPHSSPEVLTSVATLVQNLYEVGGAEGKKLALGSGMLDLTVKLLNTRDPVPGMCLSILNSLLVNEDDNDYLKTIIRIPTQPLLAYLEPLGGESDGDSGVDNTRLCSSSDALSQPQQQQLLQPTSSADNSRPSSISGPFLEVAKKGRGLSFHSEASDSSSSRSLTVLQDSGEALSPVATNSSSSLARSSRKTLKSRQTLPAVYTKAKNVTKRVSAQMAEFEELSERNAKHRYIEKCQQCPGYNCAFFNVRVPSAGRYIKGSVAKQLMGISNQNLVFLDEKSKELVGQYSLQDLGGFIHDKSDPCIFTLKIKDFSLKVQVETSTMAWEIQNMLEPSHDVHFLNGQDDLDEWAELDTQTFAMEPPKDSASSPSSAESGELVHDAAVVSPVATPPDPNITTTTTSLSTSHTTNGHVEGEGLSRENLEDNGPITLPRTMDLQNLKLKDVLKCTEEVARQMTLIDHTQLCKISALELLQKVNMVPRPQSQRNSKMSGQSLESSLSLSSLEQSENAIEKLAFRFNQVGNWVAHCILQHRELDERVTAIHQFILIAKQCLEFNNYSSVMAVVVAGLGSAPIRRLHKTWEGVSKYHVDLFKEMDLLLESGNNYKRYRDRLSTIPTPAVPYIGVFLKDLTFICDGNPDYLRGGLINVHKRRQVYLKVEEIKRLQRDAYNFQPVLELQNYFTQYRLTPDDELHSLSHELEPKMVVHRRATRSRSSTNLSSTTPNFSFFKLNSKHLSTTTLRT